MSRNTVYHCGNYHMRTVFSEWREAALLEPWVFDADEINEVAINDLRNTSTHDRPATYHNPT